MTSRFILFFISLILLIAIAPMSINAEEKTMEPAKEMADKKMMPTVSNEQRLATHLPDNEVMWLDADSGKFLTLKRDYLAATEHGIAIFVSDIATPVNHKIDIDPIRKELNQYGWTTLAINPPSVSLLNPVEDISMPNKDSDIRPTGSKDEVKADVTMAEKPTMMSMKENDGSAYAAALTQRVISAQKWAAIQSRNTILILQGRQAAYLTNALMQQHLYPTRAIVVIDANTAISNSNSSVYPATTSQLSAVLSKLKLPVLDIYHFRNSDAKAQMLTRKKMSMKEGQRNYRQFLKSTYSEEKRLAKIIYGWLKTLGIK